MSAADESDERPGGRVTRRSFLVMAGGLTIGKFALPPLGSGIPAKTRRLIGPPTRWGPDDANLLWTELDASGEAKVMMWTPDSKAEARAIEAFYQAAMKVDWENVVLADVPKPGDDERDDKAGEPRGPKPRRFEFRGGGSEKFWEVIKDDDLCTYTVTFGRIGTKGQSQTKELDDEEEVREAVAKLIAEKLAKGYVEVGGLPPVAGRDWSRPESWQEVRKSIRVQAPRWGKPAPLPTDADMDAFEAAHGFKLPPSYRAFLRVFGPGDVNFMFYLAAPGGPEHYNLEARFEEARRAVENEREDVDFASDEYVGREPITRMIVFCSWDSDRWGWDPDEPGGNGEYAIRRWPRSVWPAEIEAQSFPEFVIDKLFRGGLGSWAGGENPGFEPATGGKTPSKPRTARPKAAKAEAGAKPKRRSATEEHEHLRRIAADPNDEAARLAYADWLDRYRDPVGELIRVHLERSRLTAADSRAAELGRREEALKAKVAKKENHEHLAVGLLPWVLKRLGARIPLGDDGEIHHIDIKAYQVNAGALREFAGYPALRELELNEHPLTAEELDAVGRLATVRELHLHEVGMTDGDFRRLGRLSDLGYLCLLSPRSKGPGLAHLKGLPKLQTLVLQGVDNARVAAHLSALDAWPALRKLFLGGEGFHGKALAGLARLARLEALGLDDTPIRDDDLAYLAGLAKLKWLNLSETQVTGVGLKYLQKLRALEVLRTKEMTDADAATPWLARLSNLRELELGGRYDNKSLTDAGLVHLGKLARLTRLDVSGQHLTDAGLAHLAGLMDLEDLNLSNNPGIVGPGLERLQRLPRLRRLNLDSTGASNAAVPLLRRFTRLEALSLFGTEITERGLGTLRKALPGAEI